MNIGIVILVDIRRNVTNCPTVISPEAITHPPAETKSPKEIPATIYIPGMKRFRTNAASID